MSSHAPARDRHDERVFERLVVERVQDRIADLLSPSTTRESQWRKAPDGSRLEPHPHVVEHPPLIVQLAQAAPTSTAGVSGGGFESRPVGNLDALDALTTMLAEASMWARKITRAPAPARLGDVLRLLAERAPTLTGEQLRNLDHDVLGWWAHARIITTWDTAPLKPHVKCMTCDRRGGLRVTVAPQAAVCIYCGSAWDSSTIGILGEHIRLALSDPIDQSAPAPEATS